MPEGFEFNQEELKQVEGFIHSTITTTSTRDRKSANQRQLDAWLRGARGQEGQSVNITFDIDQFIKRIFRRVQSFQIGPEKLLQRTLYDHQWV